MNKEELITTLQACLFVFDGSTEQEIMELNPDYSLKCVKLGVVLSKYLRGVK